ncbi:MAG: hypothetical protein SF028_00985 [Candidatus Sumerlaeia bacterium]|nr:hypothetical protein [Candidatus Sumerlaeia bacterium]
MPQQEHRKGGNYLVPALSISAAALLLLPVFALDRWFRSDDYLLLFHQGGIAPWRLWEFFGAEQVFFWRPLQAWAVSLLWHLAGWNPVPYNAVLMAAYSAGAATGARLLRRLLGEEPAAKPAAAVALFVFALFGVNLAMPVVWVSLLGQNLGLALALWALGDWALAAGEEQRRGPWRALLPALLMTAAILCKESVAALLPLFPIASWARRRPWAAHTPAERWSAAIPAAAALAALALSSLAKSAGVDVERAYALAAPTDVPLNALRMVNVLCHPFAGLAAAWPSQFSEWQLRSATTGVPFAALAVLGAGAWIARRDRAAAFALAWTVLGCFPAALYESHLNSRYLHAPAFGLAALAALIVVRGGARIRDRAPALAAAAFLAALAFLAVGAAQLRVLAWQHARIGFGRELIDYARAEPPGPGSPELWVLEGVGAAESNGGLGLSEAVRLATGADRVQVELAEFVDPATVARFEAAGWRVRVVPLGRTAGER